MRLFAALLPQTRDDHTIKTKAMYADQVDKWIESQEKKQANPENRFSQKWMKAIIHFATFGTTYILELKFRKCFYHPYIYSRKGFFNVRSDDAKKVIETVLEKEATTLKDEEEVCFVISSQSGLARPNGMIFTTDRVMWFLDSKVVMKKQGTIAVTEIEAPKVKKSLADTCVISFGDLKCGGVADFKSDEHLLGLLRQIKIAANP